jgi:hypothetical protein
MKNSNTSLRIFVLALTALFSTAFTNAAHATETAPVSVKYVGTFNSIPVFQLSFTNEQPETYEITVKELVRKFQFINDGSGEDVLKVSIKNVNTKKVITYKINPSTHIEVEKELVASL